ncbi:Smr/MutS family protein [Erythrobacter sp. YT30]|uniref:Smr/MutS family protein n=1 Tax=Erythrobacter sp. YT30 TaxID=1735012 RepID=UPI00076DEC53|nr:Smr/MutS family protein [Erythrobacter sp. YT30]KWV91815.1 DNA mismatch repair protein MutS [Erythrobacter sp. YT30]
MKPPRGLSDTEAAAWSRLAQSVTPLAGKRAPILKHDGEGEQMKAGSAPNLAKPQARPVMPTRPATPSVPPPKPRPRIGQDQTLDGHWNRKLKAGQIAPDYTLDLHGHTLDSAYTRITSGLDQAKAMGARVVLVIAGRERPVDPADRATKRGAIRAKLLDWLAASNHADSIAAIRRAHIRHGGEGALYVVLKRAR